MPGSTFELNLRPGGTIGLRTGTLMLAADGTLDWGEGAVPLSMVREVRLWTEKPELATRAVGRAELRFADGRRVVVTGGGRTGAPDAARAERYGAFLVALHRAVPARDVAFRRGLRGGSPARGWAVFAVIAAIDMALLVWLWSAMRDEAAGFVRPLLLVFGAAGLVAAAGAGQAAAGRSYDPRAIPHELLP